MLARVTDVTVSLLTRPAVVNSVPAKVSAEPYVLELLLAVIVRALGVTLTEPFT